MFIGKISDKTGASIRAIRLYEELGLLTDVARSGSYRVYSDDHVALVRLIKEAKSLGFKLSEMKPFADRDANASPWDRILRMVKDKQLLIDAEIEQLKSQKLALANCRQEIEACLAEDVDCSLDESRLDSAPRGRL